MRTAGQRYEKWKRRCTPERVRETFAEDREAMCEHARQVFAVLADIELRCRTVMARHSVSVLLTAQYLNFARQVWKITRVHLGGAQSREVGAVRAKWLVRGLAPEVMESILEEIFNIRLPPQFRFTAQAEG